MEKRVVLDWLLFFCVIDYINKNVIIQVGKEYRNSPSKITLGREWFLFSL